jgi:RNA polymerase sigma-70 factor (sigma-E family)
VTEVDVELEAFIAAESPRLVGLLALYVGEAALAEELAQEALVRLCQHWPRVRRMERPAGWLTRVALNLARSSWRRRAAERRALARLAPPVGETADPDVALILAVRGAVAALPERQRRALVLRYYAHRSVAEVAAEMGCAEGTVKSLTHKAIATLRRPPGLLQDHLEEEIASA